jgi:hypothetical protein
MPDGSHGKVCFISWIKKLPGRFAACLLFSELNSLALVNLYPYCYDLFMFNLKQLPELNNPDEQFFYGKTLLQVPGQPVNKYRPIYSYSELSGLFLFG